MKHFQLKLLICSLIIGITNSYAAEKEALEADPIEVTGAKNQQLLPPFPGTVVSTSASQIADTVNAMDTPDALKYLPSLMVRKRDSADYGGATLVGKTSKGCIIDIEKIQNPSTPMEVDDGRCACICCGAVDSNG
jgi:hypothetical protein